MEVSGEKKTTPTENFSVEVLFWCHFGAMWGQCWAIWGLGWDHVGSFGGLCGAPWRSLGGIKKTSENFLVVPNRAPNTHRFRRGRVYLES